MRTIGFARTSTPIFSISRFITAQWRSKEQRSGSLGDLGSGRRPHLELTTGEYLHARYLIDGTGFYRSVVAERYELREKSDPAEASFTLPFYSHGRRAAV